MRILLLLLFSSLTFAACDRDPPNFPEYFIKFKLNGVSKEYKINVLVNTSMSGNLHYLVVSGRKVANTNQTLVLSCGNTLPFETKEYTPNNTFELHIAYNSEANELYTNQHVALSQAKLVITEITTESIKGTFSGNIREDLSQQEAVITEGSFFAKRQ